MSHLTLIEKRDLIYSKNLTIEEAKKQAARFIADGLFFDALDFLARFKDSAGLKKLIEAALEEGDLFLFLKAYKALGEKPSEESLRKIGDRAFDLEKYYYAKMAYENLGDKALIERIKPFIMSTETNPPVGAETEV